MTASTASSQGFYGARRALSLSSLCALALVTAGCIGDGGAVSVRWRIAERETGALFDPRDVHGDDGVCCQQRNRDGNCCPPPQVPGQDGQCCAILDSNRACCTALTDRPTCAAAPPEWRVSRVRVVLADPATAAEITSAPSGLDATCGVRELTTPFTVPLGLFAITLRAFDPAAPDQIEAESPSPEIRTVRKAEIVNLDVVELSVSAQ